MDIKSHLKDRLTNKLPALSHYNFRIFWLGQWVSLIGTWMQSIGQTWLVFSLTDSPLLVGLLGAVQFLPITLFSLFAGVVIDKYPKRTILLITQFTSMILAFTLFILVYTDTVRYEYILILALLLGFLNTVDLPTRQSFTIEIAGKQDLMNAIALNSATFNLARILGPSIGALIMASLGAEWCFFLNGLSFMAVLLSLLKIKVNPYVRKQVATNVLREIKDGLKYIIHEPLLVKTTLMVLIIGLFVFNFNVLIPVFTKNVLHQEEYVYGILMSSLGIGSFIGALMVSLNSKSGPKANVLVGSSVAISICLMIISLTKVYYYSGFLLIVTGIFNIWFSTTANSTLQIHAKDEYRGRVMSVYSLVFAGATPLGNMFAGYIADRLGAQTAFFLTGALCLSSILLLTTIFKLRTYRDKSSPKTT
ncbi:MFS transporter [Desulfosporosinus meridiei]|uniref:Arabinose efflux permease family protein n=1 Tax=Desulfosporosinus meridiei (strain ATCC BAA-275 / DSM 13257 / KCTC 12902 / NCIMB 13706 / S10) TaxID=768704 RepID=J7INR0_DESMD|nr:MFS transporter [Desulfosporosinus meridiei]AFQ43250.1 arabinose efflux permease family protein [Desulfosporosinus meridiei DSM 13257]